jgi:predicted type IV restriction endonuclease
MLNKDKLKRVGSLAKTEGEGNKLILFIQYVKKEKEDSREKRSNTIILTMGHAEFRIYPKNFYPHPTLHTYLLDPTHSFIQSMYYYSTAREPIL